jgi:hypothetical protein
MLSSMAACIGLKQIASVATPRRFANLVYFTIFRGECNLNLYFR